MREMELGRRGRRLPGVYPLRLDAGRLSSGEFKDSGSVIESPGGCIDGSVDARPETLDLPQREPAVRAGVAQPDAQRFLAGPDDAVASPEPARRRRADLDHGLADGLQVYHRVEGRDLVDAYGRHIQVSGDRVDHLRGQPAPVAPLNEIQNRQDGARLPSFRIPGDDPVGLGQQVPRELEAGARVAHRSISPNTTSSVPMIATTSASMWPRVRKSSAWRCAKPGARILHR